MKITIDGEKQIHKHFSDMCNNEFYTNGMGLLTKYGDKKIYIANNSFGEPVIWFEDIGPGSCLNLRKYKRVRIKEIIVEEV